MKEQEFNELLAHLFNNSRNRLLQKSNEFSRNDDRLHHFKRAAESLRRSPESVLLGEAIKDWILILDMVDDLGQDQNFALNWWEEKIGNVVNFMILLLALVRERDNKGRAGRAADNPTI